MGSVKGGAISRRTETSESHVNPKSECIMMDNNYQGTTRGCNESLYEGPHAIPPREGSARVCFHWHLVGESQIPGIAFLATIFNAPAPYSN